MITSPSPWLALVVYTIAALGLAYVLGVAVITRPIRERLWALGAPALAEQAEGPAKGGPLSFLVNLLECPACCGFWIGGFTGAVIAWGSPLHTMIPSILAFACYTAGSNFLLGRATGLMKLDP